MPSPGVSPRSSSAGGIERRPLAAALWLVLAFVTWNVVFDREVGVAGVEFTEQQIRKWQRGEPVEPIATGFSPRVRRAGWIASGYAVVIVAAGAVVMRWTTPRSQDPGTA